MARITPQRAFVALLTIIVAAVLGYALGAPPLAIAVAALGGLAGGGLLWRGEQVEDARPAPAPPAPRIEQPPAPSGPTLEDLMDAIDDPSLLIAGRRVIRANPAARALLGEHILGEDVRLAIRHPAAAERLTGETRARHGNRRTSIELVGIGERDRPWELIINDLDDNLRFVRLADRSRTQAAEKMRVDFVANASHELRTPLASLLGYIETLQDEAGADPETRSRFLAIMQTEALRMQHLVEDLMSLSRIEAEKYRAPAAEISFDALVRDACREICATLGEDPDRLIIDADPEVSTITGDRAQLAQLIDNLLGNALKYGRPGSAVRIGYKALSDAMIRFTVEDEGEGIAAEHLPRLTERFYRIDAGRSRSVGGTGLGLAIVKHIVERHRGRLDIESVAGRGTRVIVDLPRNPPALSSARNESVTKAVGE